MSHASGQCNDKYYNYITYISPTFGGNVKILECREELYSQLMGTSEKQKWAEKQASKQAETI